MMWLLRVDIIFNTLYNTFWPRSGSITFLFARQSLSPYYVPGSSGIRRRQQIAYPQETSEDTEKKTVTCNTIMAGGEAGRLLLSSMEEGEIWGGRGSEGWAKSRPGFPILATAELLDQIFLCCGLVLCTLGSGADSSFYLPMIVIVISSLKVY